MSPKIGAMTIQVFQDQVDGLARVFGPPALGALPAQRSLEALERRADLVELLRRGVFLFEPENSAQTVKQIGAFGKSLQKQEERRLVLFKRAQHALESFQRFEDLGVGRRCAKESSEGGQEMQAAGGEIEPGKIEGKTQTASIRVIVQCPLDYHADGRGLGFPFDLAWLDLRENPDRVHPRDSPMGIGLSRGWTRSGFSLRSCLARRENPDRVHPRD